MGNQITKRKEDVDPLIKINSINNMKDINSSPKSDGNDIITDLTLRNTIWSFIDNQQDFDVMSPFALGTIQKPTDEKKGDAILSMYQAGKPRAQDPASAQNMFGKKDPGHPIFVNQLKAFCTNATDDPTITLKPNVVSYPLPIIATEYSQMKDGAQAPPPDRIFDDNKLFIDKDHKVAKYPIPLDDIIKLPDTDPNKLKKLQDLAPTYDIDPILDNSKTPPKKKSTAQLLTEFKRKAYPKLLEITYVGYQMTGTAYKALQTDPNISGTTLTKTGSTDKDNTACDNFMIHHCAKQVYEQGCLQYGLDYDKDGNPIKQVVEWNSKNGMCYDDNNFPFTGVPECACLNNPYGNSLNLQARSFNDDGTIPYKYHLNSNNGNNIYCGVPPNKYADSDSIAKKVCDVSGKGASNLTLPLYGASANMFYPSTIPGDCQTLMNNGAGSGKGICYRTNNMINSNPSISICTNVLNIGDSNIDSLTLESIHQQNNCGSSAPTSNNPDPDTVAQQEAADAATSDDTKNFNSATGINSTFTALHTQIKNAKSNVINYRSISTANVQAINTDILDAATLLKTSENYSTSQLNDSITAITNKQFDIDNKLSAMDGQIHSNDFALLSSSDIQSLVDQLTGFKTTSDNNVKNNPTIDTINSNNKQIQTYIDSINAASINTDIQGLLAQQGQLKADYDKVSSYKSTGGTYPNDDYSSDIITQVISLYNKAATKEGRQPKAIPNAPPPTTPTPQGETPTTPPDDTPKSESKSKLYIWIGVGVFVLILIILGIILLKRRNKSIDMSDDMGDD
jgi:hypothetical protein